MDHRMQMGHSLLGRVRILLATISLGQRMKIVGKVQAEEVGLRSC